MSLRWVGTDKGDADRPNCRSRLVVREIKKAMKKSDALSSAELFNGMPPLESVCTSLSACIPQSGRGERQANSCNVRHQPCTLPWDTSATRICGAPEERERLARVNGPDLELRWLAEKVQRRS